MGSPSFVNHLKNQGMKKIMLFSFLLVPLLSLVLSVNAQDKQPMNPQEKAQKLTDWMKTSLKLTDDQVAKVQPINLKYAQKMADTKNSSQDQNAKMAAMKADEEAKDAELKAVLTPEQYSSWQTKKADMKKEMKEMKEKKG
jgi:hypothetical protein